MAEDYGYIRRSISSNCRRFLVLVGLQLLFTCSTIYLWSHFKSEIGQNATFKKDTRDCERDAKTRLGETSRRFMDQPAITANHHDRIFVDAFSIKQLDALGKEYLNDLSLTNYHCNISKLKPITSVSQTSSNDTRSSNKVPNVVHFIRLGSWKFSFLNYLSFLSVQRELSPPTIILHSDELPVGYWWARTIKEVRNIYHEKIREPKTVYSAGLYFEEHKTDVMRLSILEECGGIYLDPDVLCLKSVADLMGNDVTLGRESNEGLANGIILAKPGAPFLRLWLNTYRNFRHEPYNFYSIQVPRLLSEAFPHLLHIEEFSFVQPNWAEPDLMFEGHYDWSGNYFMHVWASLYPQFVPNNTREIANLDTTIGEVMRRVYYGDQTLLPGGGEAKDTTISSSETQTHS